ncbi:MAG: hypothetical protein EKK42_28865 [Pseudonocardiaceae bacterium]|nr:MAG: hypothetical protein EKK42_28865 [Pseudonocardiaceae bacterium]
MATKRTRTRDDQSHRICNLVPSTGTETDWRLEDAQAVGALAAAARPAHADLREAWWDIGDQGGTGSCVGWATGDGVMRYMLTKAGRLAPTQHVSTRYVWMASKETDEFTTRPETFIERSGTSLKAAVTVCRDNGVVTDTMLPFALNTTLYTGDETQFWAAASQRRASSYFNLGRDLDKWRDAIAAGNPVLVGFTVDDTWRNAADTAGELKDYQPATARGGHAVCAVGYRSDGAIILRNSWGTSWGDDGFGYASPEYIADGFFPEAYIVSL